MIWSIVALQSLGYADDSTGNALLPRAIVGLGDRRRNNSPLATVQIARLGYRAHAASFGRQRFGRYNIQAIERGVQWLLAQEIRTRGDWANNAEGRSRAAGASNLPTQFYPDLDDTAMVLLALHDSYMRSKSLGSALPPNLRLIAEATARNVPDARRQAMLLDDIAGATSRAAHWMLAMQNRDGGWGAFDRDNTASSSATCRLPITTR